jgi:molecular chaperone GrpE
MLFYQRWDVLGKVLPRVDDMERIIWNTKEEDKSQPMFVWISAIYTNLTKDLEKMGVKPFISKWQTVNPEKHDVMTQVPWEEGVIIDEFEKGYMLGDRVLRHAKVVVWNWV